MKERELILLPSIKATEGLSGGLVLTRKYIAGAKEYARHWPGPVTSLVKMTDQIGTDMDYAEFKIDGDPVSLEPRPETLPLLRRRLAQSALVFPFLAPSEASVTRICEEMRIPVVFGTEYTPRTERQILKAEIHNPLIRLRRRLWLDQAERCRQRMLAAAMGLQCSGTPTYDHYGPACRNALLFFDNRVRASDVIDDSLLAAKTEYIRRGEPLRLVFGGRLVAMKGVLDLPAVASSLKRLGVNFTLTIYGGGTLEDELRNRIAAMELTQQVKLGGILDFRSGWIPLLKKEVDLFVCCHPQGDPSSTYPEVMSCGVPVAGYANEAFEGIVRHSKAGWLATLGAPDALAQIITRLDGKREELCDHSAAARAFALRHAFEQTFANRTAHLVAASRLPEVLKASTQEAL